MDGAALPSPPPSAEIALVSRSRSSSLDSLSSLTSLSDSESDASPPRKKAAFAAATAAKKTRPYPSPSSSTSRRRRRIRPQPADVLADDGSIYLTAGLYSSHYKAPNAPLEGGLDGPRRTRHQPVAKSATRENVLPLPIYYGLVLLTQKRDFLLPGSIIRSFVASDDDDDDDVVEETDETKRERQKREGSRKYDPYTRIARNIYVERKPEKAPIAAICQCKPPQSDDVPGCGESCINRMMQYSCDPRTCPLGDKCTNLPFNQQTGVPESKAGLKVVWTGSRGFGLKTAVAIPAGSFVLEYRGEIISRDESYRRVLDEYKDRKSFYFLDYDGFDVIDAGRKGNAARFINHSCTPNCNVVRWKLSGLDEYQIGIFATKDIPADAELSYNYGWQDFAALRPQDAAAAPPAVGSQRCFCRSADCTGFLGAKKPATKVIVVVGPTKGVGKMRVKVKKRVEKAVAERTGVKGVGVLGRVGVGKTKRVA